MRLRGIVFLFFASFIFYSSCEVINPEEKAPTYVHIDSFQFVPAPGATGTSSHKITSAWIYLDNILVGSFNLPATVPVLAGKTGLLLVVPGITYNGLSDVQTPYPFYRGDTLTFSPSPGKVVNFTPRARYLDESSLDIVNEDFEFGNGFSKVTGDTGMVRVSDPSLVFEGNYAGYIYLNNQTMSENILNQGFTAGRDNFLEINYRGTLPFEVGLQSTNSSGQLFTTYLYGFRARADWNKVYIGLQDYLQSNTSQIYRIVIRVRSETPVQGFVSFDNFKVITSK